MVLSACWRRPRSPRSSFFLHCATLLTTIVSPIRILFLHRQEPLSSLLQLNVQWLSHTWFSVTMYKISNWKDGYCFGASQNNLFYKIWFFFLFSTSTFLLCAQWLRWYVFHLVIMLSELLTLLTISSYLWAVVRNEWGDSHKASSTVLGM